MRLYPVFLFSITQFFIFTNQFVSGEEEQEKIYASLEERLPDKALIAIYESDQNVTDWTYSSRERFLITSDDALWIYRDDDKTVKKISLLEENENDRIKKLWVWNHTIWIASQKTLFKMTIDPFEVKKLHLTDKDDPVLLTLLHGQESNDSYLLLRTKDRIIFDDSLESSRVLLQKTHLPKATLQSSGGFFDQASSLFYFVDGARLMAFNPLLENSENETKIAIKYPFTGIGFDGKYSFAYSPYSVLRLYDHHVLQTIPVASERRLVLCDFTPNKHIYFFNDGRLELKDLLKKTTYYYKVSPGRIKRVEQFRFFSSFIGFIGDGQLRIFRLESTD